MKSLKLKLLLLALCCLFAFSCANKTLIRDGEYEPVYQALRIRENKDAFKSFPEKEKNGFITTFEKGWIKFWTGEEKLREEEIKNVQHLSDQIEKRKFVSISNEASIFLVGESEDGYIPSEHEIVSLHLFLSMIYLDAENYNAANVELKRAIEYLANNPDGKETTFDDPAIRLWLAALWESVGNRDSANVDLRKAKELTGDESLAKFIDQPKRKIVLNLKGLGPKVRWTDSAESMWFDYSLPPEDKSNYAIILPTNNWYEWHKSRNTKIRENLLKSHYMAMALERKTLKFSQQTGNLAGTAALYTGALVVAAGGIYALAAVSSAGVVDPDAYKGILLLTAIGVAWFVEKGKEFYDSSNQKIAESERNRIELLKTYRMIRFLPSNIEYIDENLAKTKPKYNSGYRKTLGTGNNQVEFIWNPE